MDDNEKDNLSGILILIADDDPKVRNLIKSSLNRIGYRNIITADDGKETIEKVKKHIPDLILLDLQIPEMDGFKTCEYIKKIDRFADTPVIVISDLVDLKNKIMAYECGADDFLAKPLDVITLCARTKATLQTSRLKEQVERLTSLKSITDNLFDYKHIFERLVAGLELSRRGSLPFSVVYMDVDYLKMINMEYGWEIGDSVIRRVREILYQVVGKKGTVLSSNSDKFLLILPGIDEDKVHVMTDDILEQVRKIPLPVEFKRKVAFESIPGKQQALTRVTLSIGIVTWDKTEGLPSDKFLDLVEKALETAQNEGRNKKVQFQFYSEQKPGIDLKIDKTELKDYERGEEF